MMRDDMVEPFRSEYRTAAGQMVSPEEVRSIIERGGMPMVISTSRQETAIERKKLAFAYLDKFYRKSKNNLTWYNEALMKSQAIVQSCIDDRRGFIGVGKGTMIYITREGKDFAGLDGLLKEEITNGLGVLASIIASFVVAVGTTQRQAIWGLIKAGLLMFGIRV